MKKTILISAFIVSTLIARAQSQDCSTVKKENEVLRAQVTAYEARLGIGKQGVTVTSPDPTLQCKFLSCTASRKTQTAVLSFLVNNTAAPVPIGLISSLYIHSGNRSRAVDEQGTEFGSGKILVGTSDTPTPLPTGVPIKVTVELLNVPVQTTRFNLIEAVVVKDAPGGQQQHVIGFRSVPIVWKP
ncbi:hypothetical protein [Hymenobacter mucosus]|uniref:Uncharacterized protein n=1 Tax=Hymenobacter mucosus TaxID=1411120 RepID=A0A238ZY31_9BACT|nr:hypothetical protein [Hymenobacter mucosus]SNR87911.1 hypothetical protein SAMN06269173_11047 [Hymenobacter mucosus]